MYLKADVPKEKLQQFAKHEDWEVRLAVAGHPNCDAQICAVLAKDPDEDVRKAVVENNATTEETLIEVWAADEDTQVRDTALARLKDRDPNRVKEAATEEMLKDLMYFSKDTIKKISELTENGKEKFVKEQYPFLSGVQVMDLSKDMAYFIGDIFKEKSKENPAEDEEIPLDDLANIDDYLSR